MKPFVSAKPVWLKGRELDRNVFAAFSATVPALAANCRLRLTGASFYQVFVNNRFLHYGPAKAPHGYARVDQLELSSLLTRPINRIDIVVAGYNIPAYNGAWTVPFLQAEISAGQPIRHTGLDGHFTACELTAHRQKVLRYATARHYTESYQLDSRNGAADWILPDVNQTGHSLSEIKSNLIYLERGAPYPDYQLIQPEKWLPPRHAQHKPVGSKSDLSWVYWLEQADRERGLLFDHLDERLIEVHENFDFPLQRYETDAEPVRLPVSLPAGFFATFLMSRIEVGFFQLRVTVAEDSVIDVLFDEKILDNKLTSENHCLNVIRYRLEKSDTPYDLRSFEPYGLKVAAVFAESGHVRLESFALLELAHPVQKRFQYQIANEPLAKILNAAIQTFRHNALDIFMDCASRERAGWLCDSFYTARGEPFWGESGRIESLFMNNYRLYTPRDDIPAGMLPMNYPADHADHCFIPQWAMWFVIQLEEYLRRNPLDEPAAYRKTCYDLLAWLQTHLNEDGLLENLPGWNFIEWSKANQWVQAVSYPTNMLYSKILTIVGQLFADDSLLEKASQVKRAIIEQAYDGTFFIDHAVRDQNHQLQLTRDRSEVCQYYAWYFDIAAKEHTLFDPLWHTLMYVFGPEREKNGVMPEIAYANAFIGNYLRMELLLRWGCHQRMLDEITAYFLPMAETTGTLWEMMKPDCSLDHGFASYIGVLITKALSGILDIDERQKTITIHSASILIDASFAIFLRCGTIRCSRQTADGRSTLRITYPKCYQIRDSSADWGETITHVICEPE